MPLSACYLIYLLQIHNNYLSESHCEIMVSFLCDTFCAIIPIKWEPLSRFELVMLVVYHLDLRNRRYQNDLGRMRLTDRAIRST